MAALLRTAIAVSVGAGLCQAFSLQPTVLHGNLPARCSLVRTCASASDKGVGASRGDSKKVYFIITDTDPSESPQIPRQEAVHKMAVKLVHSQFCRRMLTCMHIIIPSETFTQRVFHAELDSV